MKKHIQCLEEVLNSSAKEPSFSPPIKSHVNLEYNFVQEIKIPLKEFQKVFTNLREKKADEILKNLSQILGYGLGSTPESDDFFLGVLTAKHCLKKDVDEKFEHLAKFPFEKHTTSKSAQIIRCFLTRNFPSEIIPFIKLLKTQLEDDQTKLQFKLEIRKIRMLGASTGYYFLLGVLWELRYNEKRISFLNQ